MTTTQTAAVAHAVADAYIAAWNETDPQRRMRLLREHWAEDARYADPMMQGSGLAQIDALIAGVHERFAGFRFTRTGTPDGHGEHVRFAWTLGPAGAAEAPIAGTDVLEMDGGRIRSVIGFLDRVPAAA